MTDDPTRSDVLVSADGGTTWRRHSDVLGAPAAAIKRVRDGDPNLVANEDALYFATSAFNARKFEKKMVATWALVDAELPVEAEVAEEPSDG